MLKKKLALVLAMAMAASLALSGCGNPVRLWQPPRIEFRLRLHLWKRVWRDQHGGTQWRLG